MTNSVDVDPSTLIIISAIVIPFIVGLLTKLHAPDKVKAGMNLVLVGITTLLAQAVTETGHAVLSTTTIKEWAIGLTISIGTYYGMLKPLGGREFLLPNKGLG